MVFIDMISYSFTPYANIKSVNMTLPFWKYTVAVDA